MTNTAFRILFVCTKFGGRSVLATHLCNRISPWGEIAQASSFDTGKLPPSYFNVVEALGYQLDQAQPLSLFEHYKKGQPFDYVIMMCSEISGEQCAIFRMSVNELYGKQAKILSWPIPDLSMNAGMPEDFKLGFARAVRQIEDQVGLLVQQLARELLDRPADGSAPAQSPANRQTH